MSGLPVSPELPSRRGLRWKWPFAALALVALATLWLMRHSLLPKTNVAWPTVARSNLVLRAACWYPLHSTNPFTGWIVDTYPGGARRLRIAVSAGRLNGVCESWFTNGQPQSLEHFKQGVSNGRREEWFANGQLKTQADIVKGKVEGVFRRWYDNGQLAELIPMKNGQPDGSALDYYPSGYAKAETQVRAGHVLDRKIWKDGEHRIPMPAAAL